jgi:hypothetical protein
MLKFFLLLIFAGTVFTGADAQSGPKPAASPPTASITGRVTHDGRPVGGIQFMIGPARTVSKPDGTFRVTGLPPGNHSLRLFRTGNYIEGDRESSILGRTFTLEAGENRDGVEIRLIPGGVITGHVRDRENRPLTGVRIELFEPSQFPNSPPPLDVGTQVTAKPFAVTTDDRGEYRAFAIPPGRYLVKAGRPKQPSVFHPAAATGNDATVVEVRSGEVAENIDIVLDATPPTLFTVSGRLVDAVTGAPIADETVSLIPRDPRPEISGGRTKTDREGRFQFGNLPSATFIATVQTAGSNGGIVSYRLFSDPVSVNVKGRDITDVVIKAKRGVTVFGKVEVVGATAADNPANWLVFGKPVNQKDGIFSVRGSISPDGIFRIEGLKPVPFLPWFAVQGSATDLGVNIEVLSIFRNGVDVTETGVELGTDPIQDLRVRVRVNRGVLKGELRFENGDIPPPGRVYLIDQNSETVITSAGTDERGRFLMKAIPAGTYRVRAGLGEFPRSNGLAPTKPAVVTIPPTGDPVTVTLTIPKPDAEGNPQ